MVAFFPPPNGSFAGDIHFDDDERWSINEQTNGSQQIDLVTVAAHEIGHTLGLSHTNVAEALMSPIYSGSHRFLHQDDIDGIQAIYGIQPIYEIPNLYTIKKSDTDSSSTELRILGEASSYQDFVLNTSSPLHETGEDFEFELGDYNQDGSPDLYAIKKFNTGSGSTELHILNDASNYQDFILNIPSPPSRNW